MSVKRKKSSSKSSPSKFPMVRRNTDSDRVEVRATPFDDEWSPPRDPDVEEPEVEEPMDDEDEDEDEDLEESPRRKSGIAFRPRPAPKTTTDKVADWIKENPGTALGAAVALVAIGYVAWQHFKKPHPAKAPAGPQPPAGGRPAVAPGAPGGVRGAVSTPMTMDEFFPQRAANAQQARPVEAVVTPVPQPAQPQQPSQPSSPPAADASGMFNKPMFGSSFDGSEDMY